MDIKNYFADVATIITGTTYYTWYSTHWNNHNHLVVSLLSDVLYSNILNQKL
jgi:hypothetical protein